LAFYGRTYADGVQEKSAKEDHVPKMWEETGDKELFIDHLHDSYSTGNNLRALQSRRIKWANNTLCVWDKRKA